LRQTQKIYLKITDLLVWLGMWKPLQDIHWRIFQKAPLFLRYSTTKRWEFWAASWRGVLLWE